MGGRLSLNKGKRAEREVIKLLQPVIEEIYKAVGLVPPELKRNSMQFASGGYDISGLDWFALEVKHHEQITPGKVDSWWAQTVGQTEIGCEPVLLYRSNHRAWRARVVTVLTIECEQVTGIVDIDYDLFELWFRTRLLLEVKKEEGF